MKDSIEARIGRYLSGEMEEQEKAVFEQELTTDSTLDEAFQAYRRIWQVQPNTPADHWDTDLAWVEFENRTTISPVRLKSRTNVVYWTLAASVLILVGISFYFLTRPITKTYFYSDSGNSTFKLADGTSVHLNKGSAIIVHPFTNKERNVELTGEAFFEVSPDQGRPFTITCGKTQTKVVGTSFDIRQSGGTVQLFVNTGKVIFSSTDDDESALALNPGEAAYFENNKMRMVPNPSPNTNAWHTKELRLYKLTMEQAVQDISDYFGRNIDIQNQDIRSCVISAMLTFKNPEIQNVLKAITLSIKARVIEQDGKYVIQGGNCS
jgi:transmembrane sensor